MTYVCDIAGGITLHDIRGGLPTHPHKVFRKRTKPVRALFIHHSGRDTGRDGLAAIIPMANWHVFHNHWAAIGYQYAITRRRWPERTDVVVARVGRDNTVRAHTRGCNRFGIGIVLQGNGTEDGISEYQEEALEGFLPWLAEEHNLDLSKDLGYHANSWKWGGIPKLACPGSHIKKWVDNYILRCAA